MVDLSKNAYQKELDSALSEKKQLNKLFAKLKKKGKKELDTHFLNQHNEVFEEVDCLLCANCCKTTSPIFRDVDITRIASKLGQKPTDFIQEFLKMDHEGDYVLQQSPCHFLGDDNCCSIYEFRPLACREYPHTDRKNIYQLLPLTKTNTKICPGVYRILRGIEKEMF